MLLLLVIGGTVLLSGRGSASGICSPAAARRIVVGDTFNSSAPLRLATRFGIDFNASRLAHRHLLMSLLSVDAGRHTDPLRPQKRVEFPPPGHRGVRRPRSSS